MAEQMTTPDILKKPLGAGVVPPKGGSHLLLRVFLLKVDKLINIWQKNFFDYNIIILFEDGIRAYAQQNPSGWASQPKKGWGSYPEGFFNFKGR